MKTRQMSSFGLIFPWLTACVVACGFLLASIWFDGFPFRYISRMQARLGIGLPEGVTYQQWHRERFGTDPPPPKIIVHPQSFAADITIGVASAVFSGVMVRYVQRRRMNRDGTRN